MRAVLAVIALLFATAAAAQSVALKGMLGNKALLVVDGGQPCIVAPGEAVGGVKVVSTSGDTAVVEFGGRRETLRVGEAPHSIGAASGAAAGGGNRIVINVGSGGHFMVGGRINNQQVQFIVDTGASSVSMSEAEAKRIGLAYKEGRLGTANTANGAVTVWQVKLASVKIGDVEVHEVDATVLPAAMPYILLGNTFLTRFQMKRENDLMVLERRY